MRTPAPVVLAQAAGAPIWASPHSLSKLASLEAETDAPPGPSVIANPATTAAIL
jgi:hypothetical protein